METQTPPLQISREELYQRIWQTPATKIAKELGISDVAMFYLCRKYEIPKPPKGYWSARERGERPPLPALTDSNKANIDIAPDALVQMMKDAPAVKLATPTPTPAAAPSTPPITVSDTLRSPHPLVERTNRSLRDSEPNWEGIIRPKSSGCLNVNVGRDEIGRAMRLLDALFKAAISRGMDVRVDQKDRDTVTILSVRGADMRLRLSEMLGLREKKLPAADKKRYEALGPTVARSYLYEKRPRGEFSFALEGRFGNSKTWYEKNGKRFEDQLEKFLATAELLAEQILKDTVAYEERERQSKIEAELREAEEARRHQRRLMIAQCEQTARWERAESIRKFVAAAKEKVGEADPGSHVSKWLEWAEQYAAEIDPLRDPISDLPKRRKQDYLPYNHTPDFE